MSVKQQLSRLLSRFRYPVSMPCDIACDLGLKLEKSLGFQEFLRFLAQAETHPSKVWKYMPRNRVEAAFRSALKKESFKRSSLFSYYFNKGWVVISVHFDNENRLRRMHLECPKGCALEGFDFELEQEEEALLAYG